MERVNLVINSNSSGLSVFKPAKWYTYVISVQYVINSTLQISGSSIPFQLFGNKLKIKSNVIRTDLRNAETQFNFINNRDNIRKRAEKQILRVQSENCNTYNLRLNDPNKFKLNNIVDIQR